MVIMDAEYRGERKEPGSDISNQTSEPETSSEMSNIHLSAIKLSFYSKIESPVDLKLVIEL